MQLDEGRDAVARQLQHRIELDAAERMALRRALDLDEPAGVVHHHVHVGLRLGVLRVVEIQHRLALVDADRHRRDRTVDRIAAGTRSRRQAGHGVDEGDVRARDRGGPCPAVGLNDVAVDDDRALPERLHVDHRAQRATDETLNLQGPAALAPARRLAWRALARRARKHAVLRGHPSAAAALDPRRHAILEGRVAEHPRVAELHERGALGVSGVAARDAHLAQLVGGSATRTHRRVSAHRGGGNGMDAEYSEGTCRAAEFDSRRAEGRAAPRRGFPGTNRTSPGLRLTSAPAHRTPRTADGRRTA